MIRTHPSRRNRRTTRTTAALLTVVALVVGACGGDDTSSTTTTTAEDRSATAAPVDAGPSDVLVFSGQGNDLVAYRIARADRAHGDPGSQRSFQLTDIETTTVITNRADDPDGRDLNGQVCFLDERTFVAGEDTGQPDPPAGFGIFELSGDTVEQLSADQVGKLTPPFPEADSQPEPYGCTVLDDGRLVTTDVGNQAEGVGTGQLIVWFPPIVGEDTEFCVVDDTIATAQQVVADGDGVLVASARPPTTGIWRYTDLPTGPTAAEGCGGEAAPERFIEAGPNGLAVTNGIARASGGDAWYVSSVISGVINEYDDNGTFVRQVLAPAAGEELGPEPYATGTPLGLAVGPDGWLYYADIGIVFDGSFGPGDGTGSVRRIDVTGDEPGAPETLDEGLDFPDAVSIYIPGVSGRPRNI